MLLASSSKPNKSPKKAAGLKLRPWEKGKGQVLTADAVADHDEEEGAKTEQERVARRFGNHRDREA